MRQQLPTPCFPTLFMNTVPSIGGSAPLSQYSMTTSDLWADTTYSAERKWGKCRFPAAPLEAAKNYFPARA
jgi:hypothetical protein